MLKSCLSTLRYTAVWTGKALDLFPPPAFELEPASGSLNLCTNKVAASKQGMINVLICSRQCSWSSLWLLNLVGGKKHMRGNCLSIKTTGAQPHVNLHIAFNIIHFTFHCEINILFWLANAKKPCYTTDMSWCSSDLLALLDRGPI